MKLLLSIDIGSTYTKGILFRLEEERLTVQAAASLPTTVWKLAEGFRDVAAKLLNVQHNFTRNDLSENLEIFYSSSAKGGLKVAALGIVPELTMKMAKETGCSAGAKISSIFSYKLSDRNLSEIENDNPDIILFTGGTDGGNESINLHNAAMLAKLKISVPVIYAGNNFLSGSIAKILAGREFYPVENVLPALETPNPEPARSKIMNIFLKNIIFGKGLDEIIRLTGAEPLPTPYSMLEFIKIIPEYNQSWRDFCVIDMGGATTDFYSCAKDKTDCVKIVRRGLPEPEIKRSVEGDIGMRVSAASAAETAKGYISEKLKAGRLSEADWSRYITKLGVQPDYLPAAVEELEFDRILASACLRVAAQRHAGERKTVYTAIGAVGVQSGKDLRSVKAVVGTGGYMSRIDNGFYRNSLDNLQDGAADAMLLLPENPVFYSDRKYLFPMLANIATKYPAAATEMIVSEISIMEDN